MRKPKRPATKGRALWVASKLLLRDALAARAVVEQWGRSTVGVYITFPAVVPRLMV